MQRGTEEWWAFRYNQKFEAGAMVRVTEQYQGSGRFANDGNEGLYRVLRPIPNSADYYLAKPGDTRWCLISHVSRLEPA